MNTKDFLTVQEAIALIDEDTPTNPVVDNVQLVLGTEYLRTNMRGSTMNYTIHLVKKDEKTGKIVPNGIKYAVVASSRDANLLEYAITDHYKARSGKEAPNPEELGLDRITTALEDSSNYNSRPRRNPSSKIKKGDDMQSGSSTVMVGEK